ncbi:MAG: FumA C-terminus/TtdB family hydratase beta subunit [Eubacteriales bacterium]
MEAISMNTSELKQRAKELKAGERVLLSGEVFTARDAAHKRICKMLENGEELPVVLDGACVYYTGPTPAPEGAVIGSCGPTTSGRMDAFTPILLDNGLSAMIGKGERNEAVCNSIIKNNAVYLCAIGGAGALAAKSVVACEEIAFLDLGCESIKRLVFKDFPLIVGIDASGGNLFSNSKNNKTGGI